MKLEELLGLRLAVIFPSVAWKHKSGDSKRYVRLQHVPSSFSLRNLLSEVVLKPCYVSLSKQGYSLLHPTLVLQELLGRDEDPSLDVILIVASGIVPGRHL